MRFPFGEVVISLVLRNKIIKPNVAAAVPQISCLVKENYSSVCEEQQVFFLLSTQSSALYLLCLEGF